jgi:uncharacterized protein YkwD
MTRVVHVPRGRPARFLRWPAALLTAGVGACAPVAQNRDPPGDAPTPVHAPEPGPPATNRAAADFQRASDLIVSRTNDFRREQGLGTANLNPRLRAAADSFARYMARTTRYGHTADGQTPAERGQKHGYDYCLVSENIGYQYSSAGFATEPLAEGFVAGWKQSPEHRKNMLDPDVVETGVAVARSANGTYYAVQMFGRPRSMEIQFKVTNRAGVPVSYTLDDQTFPLPPRVTRTHTVCRPPKMDFAWGKNEGPQGAEGGDIFKPEPGSHYVVERDAAARFVVRKQADARE